MTDNPRKGSFIQFSKDYWMLAAGYHRRILWAGVLITLIQILAVAEPGIISSMVQDVQREGIHAYEYIMYKLAAVFFVLILQAFLQKRKATLALETGVQMETDLFLRFLGQLLRLSGVFHETRNTGLLQGTLARGIAKVTEMTFVFAADLVPLVVMFIVTTIAVAWFSPVSTVIILVTFVLFAWLTIAGRAKMIESRNRRQSLRREVDRLFATIIDCVRTVWIFSQEERELARMRDLLKRIQVMLRSEYGLYERADFWGNVIVTIGRVAVIAVALFQALHDPRAIGNLFLIVMLTERFFRLSYNLGGLFRRITEAMKPVEDMVMVLEEPITIHDPSHPITLENLVGGIVYREVRYAYPNKPGVYALAGVNLEIRRGERIGIVGGSGGGKSTIVKGLLRFLEVDDGQILIDGVDVRSLALSTLRRLVSCVYQDVEISDGTVGENIAYGKPDATPAEIERAARLAHIHDDIVGLNGKPGFPQGYDTRVGREGQQLSGGQRQRIALARVFLVDAPIVVLDEATSAVDAESDEIIHQAVKDLSDLGKTVIIIAHRLGSVLEADRIFCLEQGKVVESGTHVELLRRKGRYYRLWQAYERTTHAGPASATDQFN